MMFRKLKKHKMLNEFYWRSKKR